VTTSEARRRRFTVEEYHLMAEAGVLHEDDRVELIDGEVVEMAALGSGHIACVLRLTTLLTERLGRSAIVSVQNSVRLSDFLEPRPDVALLRPREDFYAGRIPTAEDVLLLVEVSDTTLRYDRGEKAAFYARAGIPELWVVDLSGEEVTILSEPGGGAYSEAETVGRGGRAVSRRVAGLSLSVDEVLG